MSSLRARALALAITLTAASGSAFAAKPAPTSLNDCQAAVRAATKTFITNKGTAIGTCLQAVSTQVVKRNAANANAAAATCVTQFRRLHDSRGLGKQLSDKLAATISRKCDPSYQTPAGAFPNTHTLADIIGSGAGVPQPLNAQSLNAWCRNFGGDGSIDSLQEWIDCVAAAAECDVDSAIASQYPRALDWLNLAKPAMQALSPPAADPTRITDAVAALSAVAAALDGPTRDNVVSIACGAHGLPASGQTTSQGEGSDGDVQAGSPLSYTDNGDGTITDNVTGLMWEKKDDSGGIHDMDDAYSWSAMATTFLAALNDGGGFAGYTDWRIPNIKELQSIVDFEQPNPGVDPAVSAAFHQPATCTGCTDVTAATCSCTSAATRYWSSTSFHGDPGFVAWYVTFDYGYANAYLKSFGGHVRAVRGGSVTVACDNAVRDGTETDVDCGGSSCPVCGVDESCTVTADCQAGFTCNNGSCGCPSGYVYCPATGTCFSQAANNCGSGGV